jgi:SAM-dependent methyltransferase
MAGIDHATEKARAREMREITMLNSRAAANGNYRVSHAGPDAGMTYNKTYESGYYAALWNRIEKPLLATTLHELGGRDRTCLDFACGTGRISSLAAEFFGTVVGVDVSDSMLSCARVPGNVRLRNVDLTRKSIGETFDAITAFRFFLNADQDLRTEALRALHGHLKKGGVLVCNVQMNATSPAGLACRMLNRLPWSPRRNTLSVDELSRLLSSAGFTTRHVISYGYLPRPGYLLPKLCELMVGPVERLALAIKLPPRFAQQFFIVAQKT